MLNNSKTHTIIKYIFLMLLALKVMIYVFESVNLIEKDLTSNNISDEENEEVSDQEKLQFIFVTYAFTSYLSQKLENIHFFLYRVHTNRSSSCLTPPPELV